MPTAIQPQVWTRRPARDGALDAALDRSGGRGRRPSVRTRPIFTSPPFAACQQSLRSSRRFPTALDPRLTNALQARGIEQLYTHQAEAIEHALAGRHVVVITPTASGKTLCYNAPVLDAILKDPSSRALYLFPDQGARAGSARRAAGAVRDDRVARSGEHDRRLHLRRRHAAGRAAGDPIARAPRAQQSRHGALGHPAAPSALGEAVREPALRRHRRAARLPRRVRQPPVQRAAPAAPHLPPLRIEPGLSLFVGDDCQPARAGRAAHRAAVRARRQERRAARREVLRLREPAGRQPAARHPALVSGRDAARRVRVPQAQPAADRVRAEPAVDRDPDDVSEGRLRRHAGRAGADPRLSRRLSADCGAARSKRGCARARCARSCRPTRSSSASTSARSTCR